MDPQAGMARPEGGQIGAYKAQPWVIYDTVAATDFRVGAATPAIGSNAPAINAAGEMVFLNTQGRDRANFPWYCNLDLPGQLSYGMQIFAIGIELKMPFMSTVQSLSNINADQGVPTVMKLAEAIFNYSILELNLGQEEQIAWPVNIFGNAGGLYQPFYGVQNSWSSVDVRMNLPEPIECGRTQNFSAKLKIAPQNFGTIGQVAASGVGMPLLPYVFDTSAADPPATASVAQPAYGVQLKLIGRRIKNAQYGASPA